MYSLDEKVQNGVEWEVTFHVNAHCSIATMIQNSNEQQCMQKY